MLPRKTDLGTAWETVACCGKWRGIFHTCRTRRRNACNARDGAIIFSDLIGKLDVVKVACGKCGRVGQYSLARLIERHGRDGNVADLIDAVAADCPKRKAANFSDRCDARCPDLPKVL